MAQTTLNDLKAISTPHIFTDSTGFELPFRSIATNPEQKLDRATILFLHGAGERGSDNLKQMFWVINQIVDHATEHSFAIDLIIPQCPKQYRWVEVNWSDSSHTIPKNPSKPMSALIQYINNNQDSLINPDRFYISGISMGGFGVWDLLVRKPDWFKAAIPICGGADLAELSRIAHIPIWTFHSSDDPLIPVHRTRAIVEKLEDYGSPITYTEFDAAGHNAWTPAFNDSQLLFWLTNHK